MNEVVPMRQSALAYTGKQLDLIRRTVAADCDPTEFDLYLEVARRVGLDPFRKQIYAVVYNKDKPDRRKMSIITGIDGFRAVAARNRDYRPNDEATVFVEDKTLVSPGNPAGLVKAVSKCWKLGADNQWYAIAGEAYWDEFAVLKMGGNDDDFEWIDTGEVWPDSGKPKKKKVPKSGAKVEKFPDGKWATMPHVMLAKCAEAQALRKGWPEDLSGIYAPEEMEQARFSDVTASEAIEAYEADKRLALTGGKDVLTVQWAPDSPLEAISIGQFADKAAAHVRSCISIPDLEGWAETNRTTLQRFWAVSKSDALELKKIIETRRNEIAAANRA
jgi:phage recombination protein Bet